MISGETPLKRFAQAKPNEWIVMIDGPELIIGWSWVHVGGCVMVADDSPDQWTGGLTHWKLLLLRCHGSTSSSAPMGFARQALVTRGMSPVAS